MWGTQITILFVALTSTRQISEGWEIAIPPAESYASTSPTLTIHLDSLWQQSWDALDLLAATGLKFSIYTLLLTQ